MITTIHEIEGIERDLAKLEATICAMDIRHHGSRAREAKVRLIETLKDTTLSAKMLQAAMRHEETTT